MHGGAQGWSYSSREENWVVEDTRKNKGTRAELGSLGLKIRKATFLKNNCDV